MGSLDSIFSSVAKIKILRTLCRQSLPLSLRRIAAVSELPVFSVQRALQQLQDEKWVVRKKAQNRVLFLLNSRHEAYDFIHAVFDLEIHRHLEMRTHQYTAKAKAALTFADSAQNFFRKTKL